jgi:16S rRNA (cytosine967-C5)-methyltransferase
MRDGGRIGAALQVLADMEARHKPVRLALKAWGEASRFAGAKDRAFVSGLVLDALRRKRSLGWRMGDDGWRGVVLGVLSLDWRWQSARLAEAFAEAPHGPGKLTAAEWAMLEEPRAIAEAPASVRGDYPAWLDGPLERAFGDARAEEGEALAERAPVDLRVNTLKADPEKVLEALADMGAVRAGFLPTTLRIAAPAAAERAAPVEAHPAHVRGWFEVQDAGSQAAAACAGDIRGQQVLDFCAGGGGKTLALAAAMENRGQIYAYDQDPRRMADIIPRAERAGVRNLQVRTPLNKAPLKDLEGRMDLVFVDAPCTGTGTWRRHPDAKWRLTADQLARRVKEQEAILNQASLYLKGGGRLVYVTCSLLREENEDRVAALVSGGGFSVRPIEAASLSEHVTEEGYLRLSPSSAGCDGFFAAVLAKGEA